MLRALLTLGAFSSTMASGQSRAEDPFVVEFQLSGFGIASGASSFRVKVVVDINRFNTQRQTHLEPGPALFGDTCLLFGCYAVMSDSLC